MIACLETHLVAHPVANETPALRLTLPTTRLEPATASTHIMLEQKLAADLAEQLNTLSQEWQVPVYRLLVAVGHLLFYRYSGQDQFTLNAALNANQEEVLAISANFLQHCTVREHVTFVHDQFRQALSRPYFGTNSDSRTPGASDICFFQNTFATKNHELGISISSKQAALVCGWSYDARRFDGAIIKQMSDQFAVLLGQLLEDPDQLATTATLLTAEEQHRMVWQWNETAVALPKLGTVHELFERQAARVPHDTALIYRDQQLTYQELNQRANRLAHKLIGMGIKPNTLVGVCLDRSFDMIGALLAILKTGAAYLPLDANYPEHRLTHMVEDTGITLILTHGCFANKLENLSPLLLLLDRETDEDQLADDGNLRVTPPTDSMAYVNYTSGSTGTPKGVTICHRNIIRLVFGDNCVRLNAESRILQQATICFDAATYEIWGSLLHGGTCVLFSEKFPTLKKLGRCIAQNQVTSMFITAALFNMIIDESPETLLGVEQVLVGGEALSVTHVRRALELLPQTQFINGYGPTESTTFANYNHITGLPESAVTVPIGRPLSNTQSYILDGQHQLVPVGAIGELFIGGMGLAHGYLNRPELTAEKFITGLPFLDPQERLYKTGDLGRYLPDGKIDLVGRADDQVKIHGFRIELGEIEAVLSQHPAVRQVAVVVRCIAHNEKQITAYMVLEQPAESDELSGYLSKKLPRYMIPTSYQPLETLPITPNGKVDRTLLTTMANAT